jgi:hypothetical protein
LSTTLHCIISSVLETGQNAVIWKVTLALKINPLKFLKINTLKFPKMNPLKFTKINPLKINP